MRTVFTTLSAIILIAAVAFVGFLFYQGQVSAGDGFGPPGIDDGRLAACPDKPNCVCSQCATGEHAVAPLAGDLARVSDALSALGGSVNSADGDYITATFTSGLFGFVDDVELLADRAAGVVHVRSASRVGYSDMGANRKRVETLRAALAR